MTENKGSLKRYCGAVLGSLFGSKRNKRLFSLLTAIYLGVQLIPSPFSAWYSIKTNHSAIVTHEWTGDREVKTQGNHLKNLWAVPGVNSLFTKVDEHLLTEHIWFFRNSFDNTTNNLYGSSRSANEDLKNYVDVSSKDMKQTLVKVGIKYKINNLEKFAMTRMGKGLDRIDAHDRPYVLTGNEFDTYIFSAVQSKDQADLLQSTTPDGDQGVQKEILEKIQQSDLEERYGISITSVVYDARLVPEVAQANAEKQRQILEGEGFRDRSESGAQAWHKRLYTGFLNITPGHKDYNTPLIELLGRIPKDERESFIKGLDNFTQWSVIRERNRDTLIPYGAPYVLPSRSFQQSK